MRKQQKTGLDELLKLLGQAHEQVGKAIQNGNLAGAGEILGECQNVAVSMGTTIDGAEGEGTRTVQLLEDYCELVYQIHEGLGQPAQRSAADVKQVLNKHYQGIQKAYQKDVTLQKEVVFLPYKASMWDSLESVWERYNADDQWHAVVIPIPYFDKNPDGSLKDVHYEGDRFPENVPIVSYQEYNLQLIHPDRIYIHNPYDGYNRVTTVHPDYYAERIKAYTDQLVYIPYFVLSERDPRDQAALQRIAHYVRVPGVFHAHQVIVQSESMRQCYIEILVQMAGEETRAYWTNKIKGTGSPKLEKAAHVKEQTYQYPEDWMGKVQGQDGKRRKVVFYNTSLPVLLKQEEKALGKIRAVMETFRQRPDTVLLWRPHPLTQATIGSMRPDLWEQYQQLVQTYVDDDFGIYDDSPDLYRSIALSDAYYGDMSSVVHLFTAAQIPVLLQNVNIR